jgi:D-glycero-alpha-D-manno-heptose-7-phosphate kinase
MIISRTPYRISFFGGGTDYPGWYRKNGGTVLATTIDKYSYLTIRYLPPFFESKYRVVYNKVESVNKADEIVHPVVRAAIKFLKIKEGLVIQHDGDLPAWSGIGSSSAFTAGLLNALYALKGNMPNKHTLAMESIYLEQKVLKETVGSQDQIMASYGGFNYILFQKDGNIVVKPVTVSVQRIEELQDHLMLFYTGIRRLSSKIAETYVPNINQKKQLLIMEKLTNEAMAILVSKQNIDKFGQLLNESWEIKRTLSTAVSNSFIDNLYQDALSCGALGGKITGAGGGGFLILFVPPKHQARVKKKFSKLVHVPFKFESLGSQIIFYDRQEEYYFKDKEIKK